MPRRAMRSDWGSVAEIDRGRRYRLRFWAETQDGYKRCSETVRGTRRDAYDRLAQIRLEHSSDAPCPTVGEAYSAWWLPTYERRVADGDGSTATLRNYVSIWATWCRPRWADVPCDQVRPLDVQRWLLSMPYNQARLSLTLLALVADYAVRYGAVGSNPFREKYVMPSKSTVRGHDKAIWTADEVSAIADAVRGMWLEPALLAQAYGGMRVGEALGIQPADVSGAESHGVPAAMVDVRRQVSQTGGVSDRLKTRDSRRTVPVVGPRGARLLELSEACDGPWLTGDGMGGTVSQRVYSKALRATIKAAGVPLHPITSLRNSWQTWMRWQLHVPPYIIEPIMGHAVPGVTGTYYDRPTPQMMLDAVASAYAGTKWDQQ